MKNKLGTRLEDLLKQKNMADKSSNTSDFKKAQEFFSQGIDHLKKEENFEALIPLFGALALNGNCFKAANNLAVALWKLDCSALALRITEMVLERDPENKKAMENLEFLRS